jgi:hypothetical protein
MNTWWMLKCIVLTIGGVIANVHSNDLSMLQSRVTQRLLPSYRNEGSTSRSFPFHACVPWFRPKDPDNTIMWAITEARNGSHPNTNLFSITMCEWKMVQNNARALLAWTKGQNSPALRIIHDVNHWGRDTFTLDKTSGYVIAFKIRPGIDGGTNTFSFQRDDGRLLSITRVVDDQWNSEPHLPQLNKGIYGQWVAADSADKDLASFTYKADTKKHAFYELKAPAPPPAVSLVPGVSKSYIDSNRNPHLAVNNRRWITVLSNILPSGDKSYFVLEFNRHYEVPQVWVQWKKPPYEAVLKPKKWALSNLDRVSIEWKPVPPTNGREGPYWMGLNISAGHLFQHKNQKDMLLKFHGDFIKDPLEKISAEHRGKCFDLFGDPSLSYRLRMPRSCKKHEVSLERCDKEGKGTGKWLRRGWSHWEMYDAKYIDVDTQNIYLSFHLVKSPNGGVVFRALDDLSSPMEPAQCLAPLKDHHSKKTMQKFKKLAVFEDIDFKNCGMVIPGLKTT